VSIEKTTLYQEMRRRVSDVPAGPTNLVSEFERLRTTLQEHGKYIVSLFPEYTPHDHTRHLDHLFEISDRVLGPELYARLAPTELVLLGFGLYAHDWGMAVSDAERNVLATGKGHGDFALLQEEPRRSEAFVSDAKLAGVLPEVAWRNYLRDTYGLRSGARLRKHLEPLGSMFADAVAKIAEGHTLDTRDVRDTTRYPLSLSVFGEAVNLAALTTYVRLVDLLDIGDDRTPYALWKFVAPADPISGLEWRKHRALSPISVRTGSTIREVLVSGRTDDPGVFAALADLRSWIDSQFAMSMAHLRTISGKYDLDLDSRIIWTIEACGFAPLQVRFELDRSEVLGLLSKELYEDDALAFIRELLQNSVDAIDTRKDLLAKSGLTLNGIIRVRLTSDSSFLYIDWTDNGIGMDDDVLSSYFAKLGRSWYRSREAAKLGAVDAISQFGVGVLSCFAVSAKLVLQTRKDPEISSTRQGLVVEIPTRESHFRIRTDNDIPVGTTISLQIPHNLKPVISKEAICAALARIARYVRHKVIIESDGRVTEVRFLGAEKLDAETGFQNTVKMTISAIRGKSADVLSGKTKVIAFQVGDLEGEYYGHYSAVIPSRPADVHGDIDSSVWKLEKKSIELDDIITDTEQALFVKGIQTGPVAPRAHGRRHQFSLTRHTAWIPLSCC
jgi:hypothetical protein